VSLLSKLFGGGWDRTVERAERLERDGESGDALVLYEKALADERDGAPATKVREIEKRATLIRDRLAEESLEEGDERRDGDDLEGAVQSYREALEIAGSEEKEREARERLDGLEAEIARDQIEAVREPTQDETFEALSGSWYEEQWDEYEEHGEEFRTAFLAYHEGRPERAVAIYEKLLEEAGGDAVYLLYELGRARALVATQRREGDADPGDIEAMGDRAVDAFERFLARLDEDVTPALRAAAWNELAQIHLERSDPESAEDALMRAQEAVPGETAAYLNLGLFLSRMDRRKEAVEALEQGLEVMDKLRPEIRLIAELGRAYMATGRDAEAAETLQSALETLVQVHGFWDPSVAVPLAELRERAGDLRQASDIMRHLAEGDDTERLALYNFHAARLLMELGDGELASRHLARARELAVGELIDRIDELG